MAKASDLKKGSVVEIDGTPHMVEDIQISTPSARGAGSIYRVRFRNMVTKHKVDKSYKGDDQIPDIDFGRRDIQFSYEQQGQYVFMDLTDYSEITLNREDITDEINYISEDLEGIQALIADGRVLGIELPTSVDLEIEETSPSMKGASATARTKPATLTTGLVVQVPGYMSSGETVRVDTRTGKCLGRA